MDEKTLLNKLYTENGLDKNDVFKHKHFTIITRSGIEKIQYKNKITVSFRPVVANEKIVIIQAVGVKDPGLSTARTIETFGEWNTTHIKKDPAGNVVPYYSAALAEKRALSRVVLKLMSLYEHGVLGEDEEIFDVPVSDQLKDYIRSLLSTSTYDDEFKEKVEVKIDDFTARDADEAIEMLKLNQKDPVDSGDNYNQTDINQKLDKHV